MRKMWILAAVTAALGGYILLVERHRPGSDQARAQRQQLFPQLARGKVSELQLGAGGAPPLVFAREGGTWTMRGTDAPVDGAAIEELLTEIDLGDIDRAADVSPAAAGLDPPAFAITLTAGGQTFRLRGGRADTSGRGVYVQRGEEKAVMVAPRRLLDLAGRDAGAFRDRRLIPANPVAEASALNWSGRSSAAGVRLEEGRWKNHSGEWVARERVLDALRRLADLKSDRVMPSSADAAAGAARTFTVELAGGASWTVGAPPTGCPQGSAAFQRTHGPRGGGAGEVLCVADEAATSFWSALPGAAARQLKLVTSPPTEVVAVEIIEADRRLALRRESPSSPWTIVTPRVAYQADDAAITAWLAELGSLELAPTRGPPAAGKPGERRLTVQSRFTEIVYVALTRAPRIAIQRQGEADAPPLTASPEVLALTETDPLRFRSRNVLSFARHDAQRLRTGGANAAEAIKDARESWQLTQPAGRALDEAALDQLLGTFTNLRAVRFIAENAARSFRATHTLEVTEAARSAAEKTHRIEIARARGTGECHARVSNDAPVTFVLGAEDCLNLTRPLSRLR